MRGRLGSPLRDASHACCGSAMLTVEAYPVVVCVSIGQRGQCGLARMERARLLPLREIDQSDA